MLTLHGGRRRTRRKNKIKMRVCASEASVRWADGPGDTDLGPVGPRGSLAGPELTGPDRAGAGWAGPSRGWLGLAEPGLAGPGRAGAGWA